MSGDIASAKLNRSTKAVFLKVIYCFRLSVERLVKRYIDKTNMLIVKGAIILFFQRYNTKKFSGLKICRFFCTCLLKELNFLGAKFKKNRKLMVLTKGFVFCLGFFEKKRFI